MFTVQPNVYFEGMDPVTESASMYADVDSMPAGQLNPATVTVGIVALGIVAVAGSATAIYYEVGGWLVVGELPRSHSSHNLVKFLGTQYLLARLPSQVVA